MSKKTTQSADPISHFETSLAELESLVAQLEAGEMSLDDSLQAFEKGVSLTKQCQSALKTAELRIQQLVEDKETGEERLEPMHAQANTEGDDSNDA